MRPHVREFLKICIEDLSPKGPVLEVGSLQVLGEHDETANLRPFFPDVEYIGIDLIDGPNVDRVLDASNTDYPDEYFNTVLMMEVIEMCPFPVRTVDEVYRVLAPGGILIMSSIGVTWPIEEWPPDYWRATPLAYETVLLRKFETKLVDYYGAKKEHGTVVGVGIKGEFDFYIWRRLKGRVASMFPKIVEE